MSQRKIRAQNDEIVKTFQVRYRKEKSVLLNTGKTYNLQKMLHKEIRHNLTFTT